MTANTYSIKIVVVEPEKGRVGRAKKTGRAMLLFLTAAPVRQTLGTTAELFLEVHH
jgi:hypothetical protein